MRLIEVASLIVFDGIKDRHAYDQAQCLFPRFLYAFFKLSALLAAVFMSLEILYDWPFHGDTCPRIAQEGIRVVSPVMRSIT